MLVTGYLWRDPQTGETKELPPEEISLIVGPPVYLNGEPPPPELDPGTIEAVARAQFAYDLSPQGVNAGGPDWEGTALQTRQRYRERAAAGLRAMMATNGGERRD